MRSAVLWAIVGLGVLLSLFGPQVAVAPPPLTPVSPLPTTTGAPVPALTATRIPESVSTPAQTPTLDEPSARDRFLSVEGLYTILGVVIGFVLSLAGTWVRERYQGVRARRALRFEMDLNLAAIEEFWQGVTTGIEPDSSEDPEVSKAKSARRLVEIPLAPLSSQVLDTQLSILIVTTPKLKTQRVLKFYDRLARLKTIRAELLQLMREQQRALDAATTGGVGLSRGRTLSYFPVRPFSERAPVLWDQCKELVSSILAEGNALAAGWCWTAARRK